MTRPKRRSWHIELQKPSQLWPRRYWLFKTWTEFSRMQYGFETHSRVYFKEYGLRVIGIQITVSSSRFGAS